MNYKWHKIADAVEEIQFGENNIAIVETDDRKICIAKHKDELFAFAHKCPHAGGIMHNGYIDATGNVVCPLHRYKFCISNGRNVSGEGYYLKHWPVRIEEEKVYVGFDEKSFF